MKNTTKLKNILQLYIVSLDIDDEDNFCLTMINKRDGSNATFIDKSYTIVIGKAFGYMKKKLKTESNEIFQ